MRVKRYFNNLASSSWSKSSSGSFCLIGASGSCKEKKSPSIHTMPTCLLQWLHAPFYNLKTLFHVGTTICTTHVISRMILPCLFSLIYFIPLLSLLLLEGATEIYLLHHLFPALASNFSSSSSSQLQTSFPILPLYLPDCPTPPSN